MFWGFPSGQTVKNTPAMWETWVRSLEWEDPLEKGTATHSSILAWRIWTIIVHGVAKSQTHLSDFHFTSLHVSNFSLAFCNEFFKEAILEVLWSLLHDN